MEDIYECWDWENTSISGNSFDFLNDPAENIYTIDDGEPIDF